jgi:protein SCO1/2
MTVATVLTPSRAILPFALTDEHGNAFTNKNLEHHWSLVFFGFTHCPDLCPTTLAMLNQAYQIIEQQRTKMVAMPQIVFVSVDPERDAASNVLSRYLSSFNNAFIGVTGDKKMLDQLTQNLSVLYLKVMNPEGHGDMQYMIDHSGTILVINPKGDLAALFSMPHAPDKIAADIITLMKTDAVTAGQV